MKTVAVVPARMGAARLPGKVLADIAGRSMLVRVLDRVAAAWQVDEVVFATTLDPADDAVVAAVDTDGRASVVRGETRDVLARVTRAQRAARADVVVLVPADFPLVDPGVIDEVVARRAETGAHYCSNLLEPTFPAGLGVEAVLADSLERAEHEAAMSQDRMDPTAFIRRRPDRFHLHGVRSPRDRRRWRWTVDTPADLAFVRAVFRHFTDRPRVPWEVVADWLDDHPEVVAINDEGADASAWRS